jgi:lysyl oxidase
VSRRLAASIVVLGGGLAPGCGAPADAHDAPPGDVGAAPRDARVSLDAPVALVDASPFDAAPQVPDLQFVAGEMASTFVVTADPFAADDCAVMEGCVGGAGTRILLRFDTVTANRGSGDLVVGVPPPPGESDAVFQWSPCHMHHHVANYASYELIDTTGTVLTARNRSASRTASRSSRGRRRPATRA